MKIFFDTEFTGLRKNTTLISIGMITDDGRTFYAEFTDYNKEQCDSWIIENVISKLIHKKPEVWETELADRQVYGTFCECRYALMDWLQQFDEEIQFISDVSHYDFILLIDLISGGNTAFNIPQNINPSCHDINQDIALFYKISEREAFDKYREDILMDFNELYGVNIVEGRKHNSLYDAKVIRVLYQILSIQ